VVGWSAGANAGIAGVNTGSGPGVFGSSTASNKFAALFDGEVQITSDHHCSGTATIGGALTAGGAATIGGALTAGGAATISGTLTAGDVVLPGADFAEDFQVDMSNHVEPGTVMILDESG